MAFQPYPDPPMTARVLRKRRTSSSLSADEARHIAILAQGLASAGDRPKTVTDVLRCTGAVQLDTISVLARSHELVAYARLGPVPRASIENAYWSQPATAFEYYAHANCIIPIEDWPYFSFRRGQLGSGVWPSLVGTPVLKEIKARLKEGPITASDVGGAREIAGWWNWSGAKRALELMYARGDVVCTTRHGWKRVYDLPERVLSADVLAHNFSAEECYRYLVQRSGSALGIGTRWDVAGYYRLLTSYLGRTLDRKRLFDDALAESGLVQVEVEGWTERAYVDPALLNARASRAHRTTLLSPFDSLVWADAPPPGHPPRERTKRLFGYDMALEAYVPKARRIHGYFTMPLLAGGRIVGHVDPAREGKTLIARSVSLHEPEAVDAMADALREAASWVGCDAVRVERVLPRKLATDLKRALA